MTEDDGHEPGELAARLGMEMDADRASLLAEGFEARDEVVTELDSLPSPTPPDRDYWEPTDDDDPNAGFLIRCDLGGDGPLSDVELAVKDNIAVAGLPMTCGSPLLSGYVPERDATVVERLLDAGVHLVGKANMDEFAMGGDSDAMRFRLARNPHDPAHQPGGSSAGSGVAVAEGSVDAALGTDTGGSVRFPASYCGVFGVKPTRGLVSHDGFVQFSKTLDTIGVLARDAETGGRVLATMAGPDPADDATRGADVGDYAAAAREGVEADPSSLTVGVVSDIFGYNDRVEEPVSGALDALADAGAEVVDVSLDGYDRAVPAWVAIGETELAMYLGANGVNYWRDSAPLPSLVEALDERLPDAPEEVQDPVLGSALYGAHLATDFGNRYYARAQRVRRQFTGAVDDALDGVDVLASPTTPMLPPAWDEEGYLDDGSLYDAIRNTGPFNLTGHPAVSMPCAAVDGLPVGLQFVGGWYDEETLFHAAGVWGDIHGEPYGV